MEISKENFFDVCQLYSISNIDTHPCIPSPSCLRTVLGLNSDEIWFLFFFWAENPANLKNLSPNFVLEQLG